MKRTILASVALLAVLTPQAQDTNPMDEFNKFRQGIMDDFNDFRHTILEHYADFLEGTWHEYEPMMPMSKYTEPKPVKIPDITLNAPTTKPVNMPEPKLGTIPVDDPTLPSLSGLAPGGSRVNTDAARPGQTTIDANQTLPKIGDRGGNHGTLPTHANVNGPGSLVSPFDTPKCEIPPEARNEVPLTLNVRPDLGKPMIAVITDLPSIPVEPSLVEPEPEPEPVIESTVGKEPVNFYGMEIYVPQVDFRISDRLEKLSDFARHWKLLDEQDAADKVIAALQPELKKMNLNDYLTFEFLSAYIDSKFPNAGISPRMSAVHYLMTHLGYDARISVTSKTGDPVILMPSKQKLFGISYIPVNGEKYYILGNRFVNTAGQGFVTCDLPKVAQSGKKLDLIIDGLNLPRKERVSTKTYKDMTLTGVFNENLMPIVYRYPQMETADYGKSVLDKNFRDLLVTQVKEQLGAKEQLSAANDLLKYIQFGFDYATDDQLHGFEKPYFMEENFYYPQNDCEDRAILYTYLLWNGLNTENHLLAFPGHESASISVPGANLRGTSYMHDGKRFYISDPTYQGSTTGQCMPQFETTQPTIDLVYPE